MPEQTTPGSDEGSSRGLAIDPLTRREREVLALLAEGYSGPEIAERLTLGLSSVKSHIQHAYGKLGVNSKRQAVARARDLGLLKPAASVSTDVRPSPIGNRRVNHNLPRQVTQFFGREQEIAQLIEQIAEHALVTLTGSGGVGKTRLSLRVAEEVLEDFPDGVWLVELAALSNPALVPHQVASALGVRDEPGHPILETLTTFLREREVLLLLDNCEHLVEACAQLADQLLRAAPGPRILATSREALGIAGESCYPVPSLSLPDPGQLPPPATLAQFDAVRLFVNCAVAVRPDFVLTDKNALSVAQICRRLDGIPLAIELAAARVRALGVEQIAARLDNRFGLLAGGSRTAAPRQQTLRATLDWSYELLFDDERVLLRRLSVFAGGCTLEAAEQVSSLPGGLETLAQLVAKSLVLSEQAPGQEPRFRMLETIREYAQEKLAEAGEVEAAHGRHLGFYIALAEEAEPELYGRGQVNWLNQLKRENDNLRAALTWSLRCNDAASALRLAGALSRFWYIRGSNAEGQGWLDAALDLEANRGSLQHKSWRADALLGAGWLWLTGDDEADVATGSARVQESLDLYRELDDPSGVAHALYWLAESHAHVNEYTDARRLFEESLELWRAAEDSWGIAVALHMIGHSAFEAGDRRQTRELLQRSASILRDEGALFDLTKALYLLAYQSWLDGDADSARTLCNENLAALEQLESNWAALSTLWLLFETSAAQRDFTQARAEALSIQNLPGRRRNMASGHVRLGQIDYLQGHLTEAQSQFEAGLKIFRELNDENGMGWVPPWLGCIAYRADDLDRARALIDEGLAIDDPNGYWPELAFALLARGDVARAQGEPEAAAKHYARSLRLILKKHDQPDVAERLEGFAKLASAAEQPQRAARLFGAAEALRDRIGTPIPMVERANYDGAVRQVRAQLDPAAFSAAWSEGQALTWEQAAALALDNA